MGRVAAVFVVLVAAGSALAEEKTLDPRWSRTPSWQEMQAAYPKGAQAGSGSVTLHCSVEPSGAVSNCVSRDETPEGQGFGQAALSLAPRFVTALPKDTAPGATYTVDIPFAFVRKGTRQLLHPRWVHSMSIEEAKSLFPAKAAPTLMRGVALLQCKITAQGALAPCTVKAEQPGGQGFGEAALETAKRMALDPWSEGWPAEGVTLTFTVSFKRD